VLAHAGFVVVAPFLPDFLSLVVAPTATRDLALAFDAACAIADAERLDGPAIFSISFGSRPAIELCASDAGARASALVLFGGFCDFDATVRFAVTGSDEHPYDPLNAPVVHLHLLPHLGAEDEAKLGRALRTMVEETWGRPEMKIGRAREVHAVAIARDLALSPADRDLFMCACGLGHAPSSSLLDRGLRALGDGFAWVDPRPHLARVRPPVVIVHGRDDDVIPWTESHKIAAALPPGHPHEVILTGLYAHTGAALPSPREIANELRSLIRMVTLLATGPSGPTLSSHRGGRPAPITPPSRGIV
jgi:pimeloyl-ACP methyl ester carboxylesterase